MRRCASVVLLLTLLTASGAGAVSYEIAVEDGTATVNASFDLYSTDDVNYFTTTWRVGEDADIISVRDGHGVITRSDGEESDSPGIYSREGDQLRISTNSGDARQSGTVEVRYEKPADITTWHDDLHVLEMRLPGFRDRFEEFDEEKTSARVTVDEDIIGLSHSTGFQSSYNGRTGTFSGDGPVNIKVTYSDREGEYDNFILYGEANLTAADEVYPLAQLVTGRSVEFRKLPVIVLDRETYNRELDAWSAGRYKRGGLIYIREDRVEEDDFTGLVMHEVMHAFNEKPLRWVDTDTGLFDEGTAKYVEFLVNENMNLRQAEIFGETVEWRAECSDGAGTCRYRLDPRGTPDDLWSYYQEDSGFMAGWSPSQDGTIREGLSLRTFGYAYSELLIRDFVRRNGARELHDVYDRLADIDTDVSTSESYRSQIESAMGAPITPCDDASRDAMEQCLDSVHGFVPEIPDDVEIDGERENITFHKVTVPDAAAGSEDGTMNLTVERGVEQIQQSETFLRGLVSFLRDRATRLINQLQQLLR